MNTNSKSQIDLILSKINIVDVVGSYIELKKRGENYWGICPFHDDSNPSLSVSAKKGLFKCFSCNEAGNAIQFIVKIENLSFWDAVKKVGKNVGVEIQNHHDEYAKVKNRHELAILQVLHDINVFFQFSITNNTQAELKNYLVKRGLNHEIVERFKLGYCTFSNAFFDYIEKKHIDKNYLNSSGILSNNQLLFENRLMIPISNTFGEIVGFSARAISINDDPKYINSPETSVFKKGQLLYNYNQAISFIKKNNTIVIVEGYFDVIALDSVNVKNVVALMGTNLTKNHAALIKNFKIILFLDFDKPGQDAMHKIISNLQPLIHSIHVVDNISNKDPDELWRQSPELLKKIFSKQISGVEFIFRYLCNQVKNNDLDSLKILLDQFKKFIPKNDTITANYYAQLISKRFNSNSQIILNKLIDSQQQTLQAEVESKGNVLKLENYLNDHDFKKNINQNTTIINTLLKAIAYYEYWILFNILNNLEFKEFVDYDFVFPSLEFDTELYEIKTNKIELVRKKLQNRLENIQLDSNRGNEIIMSKIDFNYLCQELKEKLLKRKIYELEQERLKSTTNLKTKHKLVQDIQNIQQNIQNLRDKKT